MWPTLKLLPICLWPNDNQPEMYSSSALADVKNSRLDMYRGFQLRSNIPWKRMVCPCHSK